MKHTCTFWSLGAILVVLVGTRYSPGVEPPVSGVPIPSPSTVHQALSIGDGPDSHGSALPATGARLDVAPGSRTRALHAVPENHCSLDSRKTSWIRSVNEQRRVAMAVRSVSGRRPKGQPPASKGRFDNAATLAARRLLKRLLPRQVDAFAFEVIPPAAGRDVFEIESRQHKVIIRGNTAVSMATGLNWYLKYYCHCQVSWYGNQLALSNPLPVVHPKVRHITWARHRYLLNYCCFGYSLPFWDWAQWEQLIDWMALNGVNMPLAVTGEEGVWQAVCRRLGMTDREIREFLAGPPYLPFQWMGCLDGWGGPLPADWTARHVQLQKRILARQRELGMTPVLQGFTGHVPAIVKDKYPATKLHTIHWVEWTTYLLDPLDPLFPKIAAMWMEEQAKLFGTDHYYAADTFIEMRPPSGDLKYLSRLSRAIYDGMARNDPDSVWVLQTWIFFNQRAFWSQDRIRAFLDAVPQEHMLCLDLYCEGQPQWSRTEAFCGKPWLWCNIQDWGRNVFLGGALNNMVTALPAARASRNRGQLRGLGFVNEGLGYNPVAYDLLYELAWRDRPVNLDTWIAQYAHQRYGVENQDCARAWKLLHATVYTAPHHTRSAIDHMPTLAAPCGQVPHSNWKLAEAWRHLLAASEQLGSCATYRFDLVNVARQVLVNHAAVLQGRLIKAYAEKDAPAFDRAARAFVQLIKDVDQLLATRREFLLGRWLQDARRWGENDVEQDQLEWNARRVVTLWGAKRTLTDYARKDWSGMMRGYYLPRWQMLLNAAGEALEQHRPLDQKTLDKKMLRWMNAWSEGHEPYASTPQGDSIQVAKQLWKKYAAAFKPAALSLTTGKPTTCSHALPNCSASLANDGRRDNTNRFWATDVAQYPGPAWWQVDLQQPTMVGRIVVVCYYGDQRYYGFTVETSVDGKTWQMVADRRENHVPATQDGYTCTFQPRKVRFIRVTQTSNSANTGRHLVEVMAYR